MQTDCFSLLYIIIAYFAKKTSATFFSVILGELTELRLKQAETLAQIEDIQNGRNVEVNVCREYGQSTTLSQESILQALQVEDKTLSQQIRRKSLEFAEIVKQ